MKSKCFDEDIDLLAHKVVNFDSLNINVIFSFVNGFSGSVLLQSLIDGHPNILSIPNFCGLYFQWELYLKYIHDREQLVKRFLKCWLAISEFGSPLEGDNGEDTLELFENTLLRILEKTKELDRKKFIVAIHMAYAYVKKIDLSEIKVFYQHHHYYSSLLYYPYEHFLGATKEDFLLQETYKDFRNRKFLVSIRHFMDSYNSSLNFYKRNRLYEGLIWGTYLTVLYESHYFLKLQRIMGNDLFFVKFEELHLNTEILMRRISNFIGVDFHPCLLESSFDGIPWWGNNPNRKQHGTNPNFNTSAWENALDYRSKVLCMNLYNNLCLKYGYTICNVKNDGKIHALPDAEKWLLNQQVIKIIIGDDMGDKNFLAILKKVILTPKILLLSYKAKISYLKSRRRLIKYFCGLDLNT